MSKNESNYSVIFRCSKDYVHVLAFRSYTGLLTDTQNWGMRMRRLRRKPLVSDPGMPHGTCDARER